MEKQEKRRYAVRKSLKKHRERLREQGTCVDCGKNPKNNGNVICMDCILARRERSKRIGERQRKPKKKKTYGYGPRGNYPHHNLTPEECATIREAHHGHCEICKARPQRTLSIDHCHDTGRIRGLLCTRCNTALGKFGDSMGWLAAAYRYLKRYKKPLLVTVAI